LPVAVNVAESRAQTELLFTLNCGRGFTSILIVCGALEHPFSVAVTVSVAICCTLVLLIALKLEILPVPDAASPIVVLVFVQLIVAPEDALNVIVPVALPPHTTTSLEGIVSIGGFGSLSVIGPNVFDEHPFNVTMIFSYTPAVKLPITILPPVVDVRDAGVTATPFFEYANV
jgi:hypothetical protein